MKTLLLTSSIFIITLAVTELGPVVVDLWSRRKLRRNARPVETDCPLPVHVTGELSSPCIRGLFRPAVYATSAALESPDPLRRMHKRVTLIARRLRTIAAVVLTLVLILGMAVGCAFISPPEESLSEQLFHLPEELAENVLPVPDDGRPSLAKYQMRLTGEEASWGGWLLTVYELDQGGFEECFIDDSDHSGWSCPFKIGDLYYAMSLPTDVNFPLEKTERYHELQSALSGWVWDVVSTREGAEKFDCDAYLNQPYFRSGCNYVDAIYWPYKAVNGSTDVVWTLRLVQPVTQGDGGVWGVERVDYGGQSEPIRPDVYSLDPGAYLEDRSADNYYQRLQAAADAGEADWALDAVAMLQRFVSEKFAHENVPADSFSLGGSVTSWVPGDGTESPVPEYWEGLSEEALAFGKLAERITETPSPVFTYVPMGGEPVRCAAALDRGNGRNRLVYFPRTFLFQPADQPAALPKTASLTLESADGAAAIQMWKGNDLLRVYDGGETAWFEAVSTDPAGPFRQNIFDFWRMWFDEAECDAITDAIAVPDRGQSREEIVQAWTDAYEGAMLEVSLGSKYACTFVRNQGFGFPDWLDELSEEELNNFYPANTAGHERFAFSYQTVFVPANEKTVRWLMAGNTGEYEGDDAPEGALTYWRCGYMYLTEEGWRCDGPGTGW